MPHVGWFAALLALALPAEACWVEAGARYGVDPRILYGIAQVESSLRPEAANRSHFAHTRTYDIGLMQINSSWLPTLARWGIGERHLFDPCINIHVGAWILADNLRRHGDTWQAVGAYQAACIRLKGRACQAVRRTYRRKVYRQLPERPAWRASVAGFAGVKPPRVLRVPPHD